MEKNTATVRKGILTSLGRTSRDDKNIFSGFKNSTVYRKRGARLGVTEKYGTDEKMIEDETLRYIKKRSSRRNKVSEVNGAAQADDWRYEDALICPDRFYQAWVQE